MDLNRRREPVGPSTPPLAYPVILNPVEPHLLAEPYLYVDDGSRYNTTPPNRVFFLVDLIELQKKPPKDPCPDMYPRRQKQGK